MPPREVVSCRGHRRISPSSCRRPILWVFQLPLLSASLRRANALEDQEELISELPVQVFVLLADDAFPSVDGIQEPALTARTAQAAEELGVFVRFWYPAFCAFQARQKSAAAGCILPKKEKIYPVFLFSDIYQFSPVFGQLERIPGFCDPHGSHPLSFPIYSSDSWIDETLSGQIA